MLGIALIVILILVLTGARLTRPQSRQACHEPRAVAFSCAPAKGRLFPLFRAATLILVMLMCNGGLFAYSVLTHEEIIDLLWTSDIRPLLLQRFPGLTDEQIREAHA